MLLTLFSFFSGFLFLFWLVAGLLGLSSLLIIVFTKNKYTRFTYGVILTVISIFAFLYWLDRDRVNQRMATEAEQLMDGVYVLDGRQSEMSHYQSESYQGLTLTLTNQHTFFLDRRVPFLAGTKGVWRFVPGDDISWAEFSFKDDDAVHRSFQFSASDKVLVLYTPPSRFDQPQAEVLYFKRNP